MTPEEHEAVKRAVEKAESGLTAEIVPCVFEQSDSYPETVWAGAASAMALAAGALFLMDVFHPLWLPLSRLISWVPVAGLAGAALGRWCGPLKRLLIGADGMTTAVERRAKEVFFDRGIARTKGRDGVLIFASLLERRVVVLADESVHTKAPAGSWDGAVAAMTAHAAQGRVGEGLCEAVAKTAEALHAAGFSGAPASGNELGDDPITGDGR